MRLPSRQGGQLSWGSCCASFEGSTPCPLQLLHPPPIFKLLSPHLTPAEGASVEKGLSSVSWVLISVKELIK